MDAQTQGPDLSLEGSNRISDGQLMKIMMSCSRQGLGRWSAMESLEGSRRILAGSRKGSGRI
jgi:hypothetical protein